MRKTKTALAVLLFLLIAGNVFAQRAPLTVQASEGPAQVILDGRLLGIANPTFRAQVPPGSYDLLVRKPGLPEFRQRITVGSSGLTVNAQLGAAPRPPVAVTPNHTLSIRSNFPGAEVFLNGSKVGNVPFQQSLPRGQYNVRVIGPGFQEYNTTINLTDDQTINANLIPVFASINVNISSSLLNSSIDNPASRIELYIDGNRVNGFSAQVMPGQRQVRIVSGGIAFETSINARPGGSYTIEPAVSFQIR